MEVLMYSGAQEHRAELRYSIMDGEAPFDVIVTT